jgi:Carboxypeptidase regulatory-like domain
MLMRSLQITFIGLVVFTASAWAGSGILQGIVKDPKGQPIKGADIRIEAQSGNKLFGTAKTDVNGHYTSAALPAGTYRVTLMVNGVVKASINNTKTKAGGPTELNFDLKPASASQASASGKKGKNYVWIPPTTGSHLGGRWVEVDDTGNVSGAGAHSANKVDSASGKAMQTLGPGGDPSR